MHTYICTQTRHVHTHVHAHIHMRIHAHNIRILFLHTWIEWRACRVDDPSVFGDGVVVRGWESQSINKQLTQDKLVGNRMVAQHVVCVQLGHVVAVKKGRV